RRHGITHLFNNWEAMAPTIEQLQITGTRTNENLVAARFLLKPGRAYNAAVKRSHAYDRSQEINREARATGKNGLRRQRDRGKEKDLQGYRSRLSSAKRGLPLLRHVSCCSHAIILTPADERDSSLDTRPVSFPVFSRGQHLHYPLRGFLGVHSYITACAVADLHKRPFAPAA